MSKESPKKKLSHVERAIGSRKGASRTLSADSHYDWPQTFDELIEWYTQEVSDISRAAQMRTKEATAIVADCIDKKASLADAAKRHAEYHSRWGDNFPTGVAGTRGKSESDVEHEISMNHLREQKAISARRKQEGDWDLDIGWER